MKTILLVSVFFLTSSYGNCKVFDPTVEESRATKKCNASGLVEKVVTNIIGSEKLNFDNQTKCNLFCVLQELNYTDVEGNIKIENIMNYTLVQIPQLANNSDILLMELFQISRTGEKFEDKCLRSLISYYRYAETVFVLLLADSTEQELNFKETINKAIKEGKPLDRTMVSETRAYLQTLESLLRMVYVATSYAASKL